MGVKVTTDDGKIWLRINHDGQRKSKCLGPVTKPGLIEAEKAAAIIRGKLAADDLSPLDTRPVVGPRADPVLKNLASEWVAWHQEHFPRRASTVENYQSFIDARLIPMLGDRRVSSITRATVQEFVSALRKDGIAYLTLRSHYLPTFRKILDYAVERGMLTVNPFRAGGPLFEPSDADREAAPRPDPFTPKELEAILRAAEENIQPEFGLMLRTWAATGARSGEIRGLQVQDLDVKAGTLRIERTLLEQDGKVITGPTKNLRGRRMVTGLDLKALASHVKGKAPEAFVFEKPSGGAVTNGSLKERWTRTLDLAGVRYREPEQMRHTYISTAMSRGENPLRIAKATGHTVKVLLGHYAEWIPEAGDAVERRRKSA
ncbi:MAG TPA: site-specific integrase [Methylomirabilota bacterium]|nr:site-specific integrase [Methylomirabilota bacterium]